MHQGPPDLLHCKHKLCLKVIANLLVDTWRKKKKRLLFVSNCVHNPVSNFSVLDVSNEILKLMDLAEPLQLPQISLAIHQD